MTARKISIINRYLIFTLGVILIAQTVNAQIVTSEPHQEKNLFSNFWNDMRYVGMNTFSPQKYNKWQVLTYAGLTAIMLFGNDLETYEEYGIEKEYNLLGMPKYLGDIGNYYDKPGTYYFSAGLVTTLYGSGKIFSDPKLQQTASLMTRSLIITGLFTTALKVVIGRERPYVDGDASEFKPFNFSFDPDYMSMPSGHTSSIFAMMTVLAKQYDSWYVKVPAYTFAASVAMQRINDNKHWSSDILIGATIGYLVGSSVVKKYHYKTGYINILPTINANSVGLNIQF